MAPSDSLQRVNLEYLSALSHSAFLLLSCASYLETLSAGPYVNLHRGPNYRDSIDGPLSVSSVVPYGIKSRFDVIISSLTVRAGNIKLSTDQNPYWLRRCRKDFCNSSEISKSGDTV